jgi:hypothetical protein
VIYIPKNKGAMKKQKKHLAYELIGLRGPRRSESVLIRRSGRYWWVLCDGDEFFYDSLAEAIISEANELLAKGCNQLSIRKHGIIGGPHADQRPRSNSDRLL